MKGQSNSEISRSPRNSFRASSNRLLAVVEHWICAGASPPTNQNQTPNAVSLEIGSQNMWAKPCVREGNSPDRLLRSLIRAKWQRMCVCLDNQDVGLEAAMHLKSA